MIAHDNTETAFCLLCVLSLMTCQISVMGGLVNVQGVRGGRGERRREGGVVYYFFQGCVEEREREILCTSFA